MAALADITARARSGLDAETLARLGRRVPEPMLRAALVPPARRVVVAEIFRRIPAQLKTSASAPDALIRWQITARGEIAETWFLILEEGRCRTTNEALDASPRTTLTLSALDLLRLATGAGNPMQMFQSGRIKISGDLFFAAQLQAMFTIPA